MTHRTRTVWRVLADPPCGAALADHFIESWHGKAREAYLVAQSLERDGHPGIEVSRVVLAGRVSRLDLLNRRSFLTECDVVPPEVWKKGARRCRSGGRS